MITNRVMFNDEDTIDPIRLSDMNLDLPTQRKFKDTGQMIAPATIARVGIMEYRAKECGAMFADRDPESIVKIMTTEEDLFDADSLESYRSAPITIGHPAEDVSEDNIKELMKGSLEGLPFADEDKLHLASTIVLNDSEAIDIVESGVCHLSSGHTCTLVLADEDAEYDAKKTNIKANHVAIVRKGRAKSAVIADEDKDKDKKEEEEVKTYDQDFVDSLQAKLDASDEKVVALTQKLEDAEKDYQEKLDGQVKDRVKFLTTAAQFTDEDLSGMSNVEGMRKVLAEALDKDFTEKPDAYVEVRYQILLDEGLPEDSETGIASALRDHAGHKVEDGKSANKAEEARARMIARQSGKEDK